MSKIPREHHAARDLEKAFRRIGEERAERLDTARRSRPFGRVLLGGLTVVALSAAAATGTKVFLADGGSLKPAPIVPERLKQAPSNRRLAQARTPDPAGPIPWGVRAYTGSKGDSCILVGRLVGVRLGLVQDGRFIEYPYRATGMCDDLPRKHVLATVRNYGDASIRGGRSVLYGVTDRTIESLAVRTRTGLYRLPIAADGTFIMVFSGANRLRHAGLRITTARGTSFRGLGL
jgi:hypothetical protein